MTYHLFATYLRRIVLLACVLAVSSCAAPRTLEAVDRAEITGLMWPSPPAQAQVVYVRSVSVPSDLGLSKSFFVRVFEFVFGGEQQGLVRPMAVLDVGGVIYVADPGAKGVHRFDRPNGRYQLLQAEGGGALASPVGLAVGQGGEVYVADSVLGAVFVIKPQAQYLLRLSLTEPLKQPTGLAFDPNGGRLYVSDTSNHCIKVFKADGTYVKTMGRRGSGDGEFNFPTMLWRSDAGQLLVTDSLNFRTQIFDLEGNFITKFGKLGDASGDRPRQKGIASDHNGHVFSVDSLLHAVQIFDSAGRFLLSFGGLGQAPGEFWLPAGVFVDSDNMIYVADSYNRRVQIFKYVGIPS